MTDNNILLTNFQLCEKIKAHQEGLQHFAFSVFLFNQKGEFLLQKRARHKYHSGGLWSNSCCSHFRNITELNGREATVKKRIEEELGHFVAENVKDLHFIKKIEYNLQVGDLIENEHNFIYNGQLLHLADEVKFNKNEVEDVAFATLDSIKLDIKCQPGKYTKWFEFILDNIAFDKKS